MQIWDLNEMQFDDLWRLHEELTKVLAERIMAEKVQLERRLALLQGASADPLPLEENPQSSDDENTRRSRKVQPKYRNPTPPYETWSGRGKRPRWLTKALRTGGDVEDYRIPLGEAKTEK